MRALWLDYQQPPPGRKLPGWLLLAFGILAAAGLFVYYLDLQGREEILQQQVSRLRRDAAQVSASEAASAAASAGTVTHPPARWDALFTALEAAADDSVTLLSLQPGPTDIQMTGEARNLAAALDYVKRLQGQRVFANLRLSQSEIVQGNPQRPLRFSILAEWQEAGR